MPPERCIHVEVAGAPPLDGLVALALAPGARIADALAALGVTLGQEARVGVWGRPASLDAVLQDGDRVECYRPLRIDPKAARRARAGR